MKIALSLARATITLDYIISKDNLLYEMMSVGVPNHIRQERNAKSDKIP